MTALAGPPARALALAGAGVAALVASRGFGTPALATLGAGLVALPLLATAIVALAAAGVRVERRIAPARCTAGDPVRVSVERAGWAVRCGLDRLLDLEVDPGLDAVAGAAPRPVGRSWGWAFAPVRGDHRLPPPRVTVRDPFGLARRSHRGGGDDRLLVAPASPALARVPTAVRAPGQGVRRRRSDPGFGELDRVREYQRGDPLSRVHWAQTAKRGRLQTKELRASEGSGLSTLVILDGAAPAGPDFETAVTAAAALARHLSEAGDPAGLVHAGVTPARLVAGRATWPAIEMALARVEAGGSRPISLVLAAEAGAPGPPDTIMVVTSAADGALAGAVGRARARGVAVVLVLAGPAAAAASDLAAAGAEVVVVPGPDRVAAALSAHAAPARVAAS